MLTPELEIPGRPYGHPQSFLRSLYDFQRMAHSPVPTIAYYTVVDDDRTGWTGGLLLLNKGGRPLEFHCTLPVRPTRAHEILYGRTLRQHLIGEVIGPLLIEKCRTPISLLCVDQLESLALASSPVFPVTLVREACERSTSANAMEPAKNADATEISERNAEAVNATGQRSVPMKTVLLAGSRLLVSEQQAERVREITMQLNDLPDAVEPFERIREAIKEAQSQIARAPALRPPAAA